MSIIDWLKLEEQTGWAQNKGDEAVPMWDRGADGWQRRIEFEKDFTQAQVDACTRIDSTTTVLDACCGTGRTAIPFARKAKHVYAIDGGEHMLMHCRRNAEAEGLTNITVSQIPNWHTCMPGKEIPKADIAVSVIGPPQADILKFSECASRYCYFLFFTKDPYRFVMAELFDGVNAEWEARKREMRPAGPGGLSKAQLPLTIQFNILTELGAFPTVTYADGAWAHESPSKEELCDYLRGFGQVDEKCEEQFRMNCDKRITQMENGMYRYAYESQMYVLGWDPNELDLSCLPEGEEE